MVILLGSCGSFVLCVGTIDGLDRYRVLDSGGKLWSRWLRSSGLTRFDEQSLLEKPYQLVAVASGGFVPRKVRKSHDKRGGSFGSGGLATAAEHDEQRKMVKYSHLVADLLIFHTAVGISHPSER